MRKRIIDPLLWLNGEISKISDKAKLLYIGLWTIADDYGVLENDPLKIRAQIFPYNHNLKIERYLGELLKIDKITPYEVEGKKYLFIKNFLKYQWLSHPSSDYPKTPEITGEIQKLLAKRKERKGIEIEEKDSSFKKLKPYFRGNEMRKVDDKWWVLPKDGSAWLEFAGKETDIEWLLKPIAEERYKKPPT